MEFSAEDATRSDLEFLCQVAEAAVEAGATTVNLPDTVGYALPADITRMFTRVRARIGDAVTLSAHCHNDLGLAVANSLAAVRPAPGRWNAPSTASASVPATPRSKNL